MCKYRFLVRWLLLFVICSLVLLCATDSSVVYCAVSKSLSINVSHTCRMHTQIASLAATTSPQHQLIL